jgi:hypothetical protein
MQQLRIAKPSRTRMRRTKLLDELPLDPRDPDIVKANRARRKHATPSAVRPETTS